MTVQNTYITCQRNISYGDGTTNEELFAIQMLIDESKELVKVFVDLFGVDIVTADGQQHSCNCGLQIARDDVEPLINKSLNYIWELPARERWLHIGYSKSLLRISI
jgi:hypothetical protein